MGSNPTLSDSLLIMTEFSYFIHELKFRFFFLIFAFFLSWAVTYFYAFEFLWFFLYPLKESHTHTLFITEISEGLQTSFKMASNISIILCFPFGLYHGICFYLPGLFKYERNKILIYYSLVVVLSIIGFIVCWNLISPLLWKFFLTNVPNPDNFVALSILNQTGLMKSQEFFWKCYWGVCIVSIFISGSIFVLCEKTSVNISKSRGLAYLILLIVTAGICPPDISIQLMCNIGCICVFEVLVFMNFWIQLWTVIQSSP